MSTDSDNFPELPPISDLYVLSAAAVDEESGRVLDELVEFGGQLLSAMAAHEPDRFPTVAADVGLPTLREWQKGTMRLLGLLNTIDTTDGPPLFDRDEFSELLGPSPEPGFDFEVKDDRVRWMLSWSWGLCWQHVTRFTNALSDEFKPNGPDDVERSMESAEQWMLGCSVRDSKLRRAMYEALPTLADHRPGFAEAILDVENWRERILSNQRLNVPDRDKELARLDGQFRAALHQALHHVIWALANNHFMAIRPYLQHPEYQGPTSWETPYRLFEILMAKVEMLMDVRRHVRERDGKKPLAIVCNESISEKPASPDWAHSDPRWREFTFLDDLADTPAEKLQWKLWEVLRPKFSLDQPTEFTEFSSCSAHLSLTALDLDEGRQQKLIYGLAGSGVRVPGTQFVLRVARPWYAFFEKRSGEFPALPHNWMEALHLTKGGFNGMYEWIGRRHDWQETVVHWDRYDETPSGWRLKPRPTPELSDAEWQAVTNDVIGQTTEFIDNVLPAIAARDPAIFTAHLELDAGGWTEKLRTLDEWTNAANRIRSFLNAELTPMPRVLDLAEFKQFTWGGPSIDYAVQHGRFHWKISCYAEIDWLSAVHSYFRRDFGWPPKDESHPGYSIEATKRWLLAGSVQDPTLWNALTAGALPAVANHDPEFARRLLDLDDWRRRIETNPAFDDSERKVELAEFQNRLPFKLVVHNAILHVIGSLANNHFGEIRSWIDHQWFVGGYTPLVPHYLFANLLAKAHTIQKHCPNKDKYGPIRQFLG